MYAVALAMNSSLPHLDRLGIRLEEFNLLDTNTSATYTFEVVIQEELTRVQFLGVSVSAHRLYIAVLKAG